MYRCAIKALRVTRTGTYAQVQHHKERASGYTRSCAANNAATNRRCTRSQSNTPQVKKLAPLTTQSSSLRCMCIVSRAPHCRTVFQNRQEKKNISEEAIYHGILARTSSRYLAFEKLFWKPSEDAS